MIHGLDELKHTLVPKLISGALSQLAKASNLQVDRVPLEGISAYEVRISSVCDN